MLIHTLQLVGTERSSSPRQWPVVFRERCAAVLLKLPNRNLQADAVASGSADSLGMGMYVRRQWRADDDDAAGNLMYFARQFREKIGGTFAS